MTKVRGRLAAIVKDAPTAWPEGRNAGVLRATIADLDTAHGRLADLSYALAGGRAGRA